MSKSTMRSLVAVVAAALTAGVTAAAPAYAHHTAGGGYVEADISPVGPGSFTVPIARFLKMCVEDSRVGKVCTKDQKVKVPPQGGVLSFRYFSSDGTDMVGPHIADCGADGLGKRIYLQDGRGTLTFSATFTPRDPLTGALDRRRAVSTGEQKLSGRDIDANAGVC